jgi:hypothetical protein
VTAGQGCEASKRELQAARVASPYNLIAVFSPIDQQHALCDDCEKEGGDHCLQPVAHAGIV